MLFTVSSDGKRVMGKFTVVSAKIPEEVFKELALRIPEGERSTFIREAILEKLEKTPRPDRVLGLEQKVNQLENAVNKIKDGLAKLELLTYEGGKVNPHTFCIDEIDNKLVDYLIDHRGATTTELAEFLETNRWLVLNRLRKIEKSSKKQLGKPIIDYYPGERAGKRKAWWIKEDLIET
jgi:predicted translin family RNA/ssDNA-binding protein